MKALSRSLLSVAAAGGAVAALSAQAQAALQLASQVLLPGVPGLVCVDNSLCDSDPAVGVISIPPLEQSGVTATGIEVTSTGDQNAPAALDVTIGSVSNSSGVALPVDFAIGDTNFTSTRGFQIFLSVTWTNAAGSSLNLSWFADSSNQQGANSAADAPGTQFGATMLDSPESGTGTVTFSDTVPLNSAGPFSFTLEGSVDLTNGAELSATESVTAVPEASTWTMLLLGFAGLGVGSRLEASRRPRLRRPWPRQLKPSSSA
jgi:hypothetical protein